MEGHKDCRKILYAHCTLRLTHPCHFCIHSRHHIPIGVGCILGFLFHNQIVLSGIFQSLQFKNS